MSDRFPDLLNIDGDGGENFWPSLTDIMMVVVMIFLISTATLIIRNWSLVQDLTATVEAERAARQKVRLTMAENLTLEERVAALEGMVSELQLRKMRSNEEKTTLKHRIEGLVAELANKTSRNTALARHLEEKTEQLTEQREKLAQLERSLADMHATTDQQRQTLETLRARLQEKSAALADKERALTRADETITSLRLEREAQQRDLEASRQSVTLTEENLARLRERFAELERKYNKLVRPARTTKGKVIVSARLRKVDGENHYAIKPPGGETFEKVDETTLHRRLAALKEKYGDKLYVRIIFPDDNGLSYKEAYRFTNDILSKYDYYHAQP